MKRADWQGVFKKRFKAVPDSRDSQPGEITYEIPDKQFVVIIRSPTPTGALRAESVTDSEECLVINRGQGRRAFVDWEAIEAISTSDN
ncbi:MAG: hypothetical protein NDI60_08495 [Elusimicrobiales bacterium]|nr:hypothetical protein [Elusimicrobiales bacterium]